MIHYEIFIPISTKKNVDNRDQSIYFSIPTWEIAWDSSSVFPVDFPLRGHGMYVIYWCGP